MSLTAAAVNKSKPVDSRTGACLAAVQTVPGRRDAPSGRCGF